MDPEYLKYVAEIIASLPFNTEDEPQTIVHNINRIISLSASEVLSSLKPIFSKDKITKKGTK